MLVSSVLSGAEFIEVADGDVLLEVMTATAPALRLALIDLQMPNMFSGKRLAEIARLRPDVPLIALSSISSQEVTWRVMKIPTVYALVPRSASAETMRAAIEAAIARMKFSGISDPKAPAGARLTPRQEQIHALLRCGMRNKMIAAELGISVGTVKNHVRAILKVLNASNRTQAAQTEVTDQ